MPSEPDPDDLPQPESAISHEVSDYEKLAREAVSSGQLLSAIEMARDGLARFGESRVLKQVLALSLAQTGALDAARQALDDVLKDSANDVETLCLIGRVYKELWRHASNRGDGLAALRQSSKFYSDAFVRDESYYPGINLAFTLAALGEKKPAVECAGKVAAICRRIVAKAEGSAFTRVLEAFGEPKPKPDAIDYGWALATLAEARLLQGEHDDAATYYRRAASLFHGRWRDLASMRRQAHEILGLSQQPVDWLDRCFSFPTVVAFCGHMIDAPDRAQPRFPAAREPQVREAIRVYLDRVNAGFGYSSAASGSDIIFGECLLDREARVNLVLPCSVDNFKRLSVSPAGAEWEKRFHHVLANSSSVVFANPPEFEFSREAPETALGFTFANRIVTGMAALQARALDLQLNALAVWNGQPGDGAGGTATVVADWQRRGLEPHIISPGSESAPNVVSANELKSEPHRSGERQRVGRNERDVTGAARADGPQAPRHEIKAMLFGEVLNYARLAEHEMLQFVSVFKEPIARIMAARPRPPVAAEVAGATFSLVFDELSDAAELAIEARDFSRQIDWAKLGLPPNLALRVFLHAGPVYVFKEPLLERTSCMGTHLTRAARIAHIVPAGQVYVSQEFAALAGAEKVEGVSFEYLGVMPTSQLFYNAPIHRLDRTPVRAKSESVTP